MESYKTGQLLPCEIDQALEDDVAARDDKQRKATTSRVTAQARVARRTAISATCLADFANTHAFIADNVASISLTDALAKARIDIVTDRINADLHVVADPARPGQRDYLYAIIFGRSICSVDLFLINGPIVSYERGLRVKRCKDTIEYNWNCSAPTRRPS